jgi:RND family efflux transporter MFP subunit
MLACALGAASCGRARSATIADAAAAAPTVAVVAAARADLVNTLTLTAEFDPFQEIDVMAKVSGYVHSITVDVGDRVRTGHLLATLESPEMADDLTKATAGIDEVAAESASARGEVTRAQSAHDVAHLAYQRLLDVSTREPGLVPLQDVDEARARDLVAEAQLAGAMSKATAGENHVRMARADEARVKTLENYTRIVAPFDGVVTKRYANVGAMIQAGTASQSQAMPLIRLSENRLLRLIVPVPESSVRYISVGQAVTVRVQSLGRTFDGRVARFTNRLQTSTRTMDTEIDVPNPTLTLIPGMYAEADLVLQSSPHALVVPLDAIDGLGSSSPHVFVVSGERIHVTAVKTGIEGASQVEVLEGVHEGDRLVVGRHAGLSDGERVHAVAVARAGEPAKAGG